MKKNLFRRPDSNIPRVVYAMDTVREQLIKRDRYPSRPASPSSSVTRRLSCHHLIAQARPECEPTSAVRADAVFVVVVHSDYPSLTSWWVDEGARKTLRDVCLYFDSVHTFESARSFRLPEARPQHLNPIYAVPQQTQNLAWCCHPREHVKQEFHITSTGRE